MTDTEPSVRITLTDIWRQGLDTSERLGKVETALESLADQRRDIEDHETRIRSLEGTVAALPAPPPRVSGWAVAAVLISAAAVVVAVIAIIAS